MSAHHVHPLPQSRVHSSNIKSMGFDESTHTLDVTFRNGGVYRYLGVNPQTYTAVLTAKSIGKAFRGLVWVKQHGRKIAE